ncbi:MAG: serine/threonine protein kinase [Thermoguttaceae bacterium]
MGNPSAEQLLQRALDLELLTERQFQEVRASVGTRLMTADDVKKQLLRGEYMTSYQLDRVAKGERSGFFYGPYKVLYAVGAGTFARVFRAVHRQTGEIVALKVLRSRFSDPDKPEQAAQFMREGKLGLTLRHPNIVPIYDVASEGRSHYLVMEFVEGWNLRDLVKIRTKIEPLQATRLMMEMVEGLRYAFDHGLTHRDLKLNNVLVNSSGQAKLVDFGLAALDESLSEGMDDEMPNTRTIDYVGLERATGVRKDDTRSDIYFMGCMFYHMLTGQAPLMETRDRTQRMYKQRFLDVIPIHQCDPTLPHWVCTVVSKAMMLDVARRYQSPAAMLADLAIVERQLIEGIDAVSAEAAAASMGTYVEAKPHTVLVVESDPRWQEIFREGFKKVNYRVLLIADPARAVARLHQDNKAAECVIFSAQVLGEAALNSFNMLSSDDRTVSVPAVLLLDEPQKGWKKHASVAEHRIVMTMPITMKDLRSKLAALMDG